MNTLESTCSPEIVQEIARLRDRLLVLAFQCQLRFKDEMREIRERLHSLIEQYPEEAAVVDRVHSGEGSEADKELMRA